MKKYDKRAFAALQQVLKDQKITLEAFSSFPGVINLFNAGGELIWEGPALPIGTGK